MENGRESGTSPAAYPTWAIRSKKLRVGQYDFSLYSWFLLAGVIHSEHYRRKYSPLLQVGMNKLHLRSKSTLVITFIKKTMDRYLLLALLKNMNDLWEVSALEICSSIHF